MAGDVVMPVAQRNRRVRTLQPEGVFLFGQRDAEHHVVHLADAGIAREEIRPVGVHERGVGRNAHGLQHGLHEVGKALAVAEAALLDLAGRERLVTADAQLDAHVARVLPEIVVQDADLLKVGTGRGGHVLQLALEGFRKVVRALLESIDPGAHVFPGALAAGDAGVGEVGRAGEDVRDNLPPGRHEHLVGKSFEDGDFPAVGIGLAFLLAEFARLGVNGLDRGSGGNLKGVGALLELDFLFVYGEEGGEGRDALLVGHRVFVGDGEGIGGVRLVADDESVLGQSGCDGHHHQVFLLDLQGFCAIPFQGSLEGGQRVELVGILMEDGLFQSAVIEDADRAHDLEASGRGGRHGESLRVFQDDGVVFLLGGEQAAGKQEKGGQDLSHCFFRTMVLFSMPAAFSQNRRRS